jgi:basic membrane protein A
MRSIRWTTLTVTAGIALAASGCGKSADGGSATNASSGASGDGKKAALVIAQGGLGDKSYNDLAYAGFKKATAANGVEGRPIESNDIVAQAQPILERATKSGFGLVIDLEFSHLDTLAAVAKANPDTQYGFLNETVKGDNVSSVVFSEQESSYLAGVLAASMTTVSGNPKINAQSVIGVIGGTKGVGIDKFLVGYIQGARSVDPKIKVLTAYSNDFGDPTKGKQIAESMYDRGADIVYSVAGGTGAGVFKAAKQRNRYAIGVDTDQDGDAPGFVLTSVIKRSDMAVEQLVDDYAKGTLKGGKTTTLGLKQDGVGLTDMKYTKDDVPQAAEDRVAKARAGIIDGSVKVWNVVDQGYPGFYKP